MKWGLAEREENRQQKIKNARGFFLTFFLENVANGLGTVEIGSIERNRTI